MFSKLPNERRLRAAERKLWEGLYGDTPKAAEALRDTKAAFRELFADGHRHSLRPLIEEFAAMAKAGETLESPFHLLGNVHPDAWELILEHGRDYVPLQKAHQAFATESRQPAQTYCFLNAYEFTLHLRQVNRGAQVAYVEGFVFGPIVYPMLHCWNGAGFTGRAIDWTFYASARFSRYFGVPFTVEEYEYILGKGEPGWTVGMLFREDTFSKREAAIREVLTRPRTRHPKVLATSIS